MRFRRIRKNTGCPKLDSNPLIGTMPAQMTVNCQFLTAYRVKTGLALGQFVAIENSRHWGLVKWSEYSSPKVGVSPELLPALPVLDWFSDSCHSERCFEGVRLPSPFPKYVSCRGGVPVPSSGWYKTLYEGLQFPRVSLRAGKRHSSARTRGSHLRGGSGRFAC